jgi:predicted nucleic acid-binding protein
MGTPEPDLFVLDASVLVQLGVAGEHRAGADALLDRYRTPGRVVLITAAHGLVEAASAVRRMTVHGVLTAEAGAQAIGWLGALDLILDATGPPLRRVWALRDRMSAYDAAYAAAAEAFEAPLMSTDPRLLSGCQDTGIPERHLAR